MEEVIFIKNCLESYIQILAYKWGYREGKVLGNNSYFTICRKSFVKTFEGTSTMLYPNQNCSSGEDWGNYSKCCGGCSGWGVDYFDLIFQFGLIFANF